MSEFKSSNSTEFKSMGNLAKGYTVIPNDIMNDIANIGSDGFTILAKIFQYINSPIHKVSVRGLSTQTKLSKDRVSKALKKLIEIGYIVREPKKQGNLVVGYAYLVYDTPVGNTTSCRSPENQDTEIQDTENKDTNNTNINHYNLKKENSVVVVQDSHTNSLIELYKSFKLEKRVMPHTIKLLKDNAYKLDMEVWNEIFINASEEGVVKKYQYIKAIIKELALKGVKSLDDYNRDILAYKENVKQNRTKIFAQNGRKNTKDNGEFGHKKTDFHNFNETFTQYTEDELEDIIQKSQDEKYGQGDMI